jgi:hypothetical protein
MLWVLAIVVVLIAAAVSPAVRKLVLWLVGIAVVVGAGLFVWLYIGEQSRLREEEAAKTRVPKDRVELTDLRMNIGGSGHLSGRVRNNDTTHTITGFALRLRIQDCEPPVKPGAEPGRCDTVGDETRTVYMSVPPNQVREIREWVSFSNLGAERPGRTWSYALLWVQAEP